MPLLDYMQDVEWDHLSELKNKKHLLTQYIANKAFNGSRKFTVLYQHRQIVDLAFNMNKIKRKYNALATFKFENSAFQTPHYA